LPKLAPAHEHRHAFTGLYVVCLALTMKQKVGGNEVNADAKDLVIITGANQGGKSTG
jgi:DNA mismatch repair ATPase MutS